MKDSQGARIIFWTAVTMATIIGGGFWLLDAQAFTKTITDDPNIITGIVAYGIVTAGCFFFGWPALAAKLFWSLVIAVPGTFVSLSFILPWISDGDPLTNGETIVCGTFLFLTFAISTLIVMGKKKWPPRMTTPRHNPSVRRRV